MGQALNDNEPVTPKNDGGQHLSAAARPTSNALAGGIRIGLFLIEE